MLICFAVFAGGAFAGGVGKELPATATVRAGNPYLAISNDPSVETGLTGISFGDVGRGNTTQPAQYYIKNTGWVDFTTVDITSSLLPADGIIISDVNNFSLAAGEIKPIKLSLAIEPDVNLGKALSFNIIFTGN
jgi:hypothetical protein